MTEPMELEGKGAVITGASADIGTAVGLLSRRGDGLGLERGLRLACDVRDRAAVATAATQSLSALAGGTVATRAKKIKLVRKR